MEEKKPQKRKAYSKDGLASKMMSFRLDKELIEPLQGVKNKGRLINELLKAYLRSRNKFQDESQPTAIDDYEP